MCGAEIPPGQETKLKGTRGANRCERKVWIAIRDRSRFRVVFRTSLGGLQIEYQSRTPRAANLPSGITTQNLESFFGNGPGGRIATASLQIRDDFL
jgi:hypothetical protein